MMIAYAAIEIFEPLQQRVLGQECWAAWARPLKEKIISLDTKFCSSLMEGPTQVPCRVPRTITRRDYA
jgi:hypothetical protein